MTEPETAAFERTYPAALDYERIALQRIIDAEASPGRHNVQAFVVSINVCPEDHMCFLPDGITLGARRDAEGPGGLYHIAVDEPRQFAVGRRYVFSVEVADAGWNHPETGRPMRTVRLLGYD